MKPCAYAGTMLRIDLSTGTVSNIDTHEYSRLFLGGRGIAAMYYWNEVAAEADAFDEDNCIIIALGPLAGIPELGGSRWGMFAKSPFPLRQHFCYGNLGGTFGAELKFAGYDGLIITGKAEKPVSISVSGKSVRILDASSLWGKSTVETMRILKSGSDAKAKALAIGPAGENRVPFATVFADGDASCAGGIGAVMGAKNLKAILVRGEQRKVKVHDAERLHEIASYIRSLGRGNVRVWGMNFMAEGPNVKMSPCYGCMAHCLRTTYTAEDGTQGKFMCQSRFFYFPYSLMFYGEDNDVPFLANRACDEYGMDTWEVQGVVEWLSRCFDAGLLSEEQTGLPLSQIGSLEFIRTLITTIAERKDFGDVLAGGAFRAAERVGEGTETCVVHPDPYEPRLYNINTLLFPFEPRQPIQQLHEAGLMLSQWVSNVQGVKGAHISSSVLKGIAREFWGGEKAADLTTLEGKALAAFKIQNRQYAKESLMVCDWMYPVMDKPKCEDHVGDPTIESTILSAATGIPHTEEELYRIGERVFNVQRAILLREGHRARIDDVLPRIWHEEPLADHIADMECLAPGPDGAPVSRIGEKIDMQDYERLREEYYLLRKWDPCTGLQTRRMLEDLDIGPVADGLGRKGLLAPGD